MIVEHKQIIDLAFSYKRAGEYEKAATKFKEAIDRFGETGETVGMLAGILRVYLERPKEALPYAKRSVVLSPSSELASIGLVHCLFDLDLREEIEPEIRRYFAIGKKFELYEVLLKENGLTKEDFT